MGFKWLLVVTEAPFYYPGPVLAPSLAEKVKLYIEDIEGPSPFIEGETP